MLKRLRFCILGLWGLGLIFPIGAFAETMVIKYPMFAGSFDAFAVKVLALSLDKSKINYELSQVSRLLPQERALTEVKKSGGLNLVWAMTSSNREAKLRAIRIPIDKGLIGWRLLLIKKKDEAKFAKIKDVESLKKLLAGQGHDWPDTEILKANGFNVFGSPSFGGLFQMLKTGRIDFMSRSVSEIWGEVSKVKSEEIVVEKTIALHYPTAAYFFVHRENRELAEAIEKGFQIAIKDKSYEKLFNEWLSPLVEKARLKDRRVFELNNPMLSKETPLSVKEYWFQN